MDHVNDFVIENDILVAYVGPGGDVTIPETVTGIDSYVFYKKDSIRSLIIPDSVKAIGSGAFSAQAQLEAVTLPVGLTKITSFLFSGCIKLKEVKIPEGVTVIDSNAFSGCYSLEELIIPDSVETIGDYAFNGCSALKHIKLPAGLKRIGRQLLSGCKSLKEIAIPEGVTKIGMFAFAHCTALETLELPSALNEIEGSAFLDCTGLKTIMLPIGVKEIRQAIFSGCSSLSSVPFTHDIKNIEGAAFAGCTGLLDSEGFFCYKDTLYTYGGEKTNVILPHSVTRIAPGCFHGCKNIQSITVPETALKIGYMPVLRFSSLEDILTALSVSQADNPDVQIHFQCGVDFFSEGQPWIKDVIAKAWLFDLEEYSPELVAAIKKYIGRVRDRLFMDIQEDNGEVITKLLSCGKVKPEKIQDYIQKCDAAKRPAVMAVLLDYQNKHVSKAKQNELTEKSLDIVEQTAKVWSKIYRWTEAEGVITLEKYKGHDAVVEIPWHIEGVPVTVIGKNAFKNNITLEEIRMTPNIVTVMESGFEGCVNLKEIQWSENLSVLEKRAFYNCHQLTSVRLPDSLVELGINSFGGKSDFDGNTLSYITLMHLSDIYLPAKIKKYKGFLGAFSDYHVQVHFAGDKTKITDRDFKDAQVTLHVPAGSKTEEYAKRANMDFVAE